MADTESCKSRESQLNALDLPHHHAHIERETWSGKLDFILSCIGYAVGLGNIWRFPYLCYRSGGGAFLVPYFTFLVLCGMPLIMLEMSFGQFASLSPTTIFAKFCPLFQGLGWGMVIICFFVCIYYNIIITWTLYYFFLSFRAVLPWVNCDNDFNTDACVTGISDLKAKRLAEIATANATSIFCGNTSFVNGSLRDDLASSWNQSADLYNLTELCGNSSFGKITHRTASEEFWIKYVLQLTDGIEDMGGVRLELLGCLFLAWVLVFACLFKGVKSSGKVVYVTATFPYMVLIILCFRGCTLPGASDGIYYYLVPEWSKLLEIKVWLYAASQIFYSVGAAWGAIITMSSYNKFHHNCYRDAIIIPLINCATSIFAGIVVFSIIGFMAHESGMDVGEVISSGPGLAFVVYPEAVSKFPLAPVWAVLFFIMLLTIGVDSQFGMFETLVSALVDEFPGYLRQRKVAFTGIACAVMFFAGIPCIMQGGMYVLTLMDWYSATFSLMIISFFECVLVAWNYGYQRFFCDIQLMVRRTPSKWWMVCWGFITPTVILGLLIMSIVYHVPVYYDTYQYPPFAIGVGWVLAMLSIAPIPFFAIYNVYNAKGSLIQRIKTCLRPTPEWGPSRIQDRVVFRKSFKTAHSGQEYVAQVDDLPGVSKAMHPSYRIGTQYEPSSRLKAAIHEEDLHEHAAGATCGPDCVYYTADQEMVTVTTRTEISDNSSSNPSPQKGITTTGATSHGSYHRNERYGPSPTHGRSDAANNNATSPIYMVKDSPPQLASSMDDSGLVLPSSRSHVPLIPNEQRDSPDTTPPPYRRDTGDKDVRNSRY